MEILHRILENFSDPSEEEAHALKRLRELGFDLEEGLSTFVVKESNPVWPKVHEIITKLNSPDREYTTFTKAEKQNARYLELEPTWQSGYPWPDEPSEYKKVTYDLSQFCANCGVGKRQNAPFRFSKAPKWGSRLIFQLNWVYDEFFVRPDIWERIFEPFGIGCREVVHHRSGEVLDNVVQLRVDEQVPLSASGLASRPTIRCLICERERYEPIKRGSLPFLEKDPDQAMVKSEQWFACGVSAWQPVIVSHDLFDRITKEKLKGVDFAPLGYGDPTA